VARGDRLETLGRGSIKPKLDLQATFVRNERRQTIENEPYGIRAFACRAHVPEERILITGDRFAADLERPSVPGPRFFAQNYVADPMRPSSSWRRLKAAR